MRPRKILVAFDGSAESEPALGWGADLAYALGSDLVVVSVIVPKDVDASAAQQAPDEVLAGEIENKRSACRERLPPSAAKAEIEVLVAGHAGKAIADFVLQNDVDLIVVGHTHGGIARTLVESIATYLVNFAPCPVTVVRTVA